MKILRYIFIYFMPIVLAIACSEDIDPISEVEPGPDVTAPELTISYPGEGAQIRVKEDVAKINIQFTATDDIELQSVSIKLDGNEIQNLTSFKDYRRLLGAYLYENLTNGVHTLNITATDLSGKSTFKSVSFQKVEPYKPKYAGEIFYMPFDGDFTELINITEATKVGSPVFGTGKIGAAYAGATDAYLTLPTTGYLGTELSVVFWYKINSSPDRSGILTVSPPDPAHTAFQNDRTRGFRFFREGNATSQTFKLNVGDGTADSWFDGGATASINPATTADWIHLAFTISATKCAVYINGNVVSEGNFAGVKWTDCNILSIASGAPRFTEWNHLSDLSLYDELRMFNKALTQAEIQAIIDAEK